jgi:hypothetical protein
MVSVLPIGLDLRGIKPSRVNGFLRAIKNQLHAVLRRGIKRVGPLS